MKVLLYLSEPKLDQERIPNLTKCLTSKSLTTLQSKRRCPVASQSCDLL